MFNGEALGWPRVKDAWLWQTLVREPAHPQHHDVIPERCQGAGVGWHRVIGKEARHHLPQPLSLARDRIVHPAPKLLLDLPHFGPFAVASGPPKEQKPAASRPAADMGVSRPTELHRQPLA